SAEPEARLMIALDERIDRLIVSSIFGEAVGADGPDKPGSEAKRPRTAIEAALLEAFARALGEALEAAFAPLAPIALRFERLLALGDPFALGRRGGEAVFAWAERRRLRGRSPVAAGVSHGPPRRARARSRGRGGARRPALVATDGSRRAADEAAGDRRAGGGRDESRRCRRISRGRAPAAAMQGFHRHSARMFGAGNVRLQTRRGGRPLPARSRERDRAWIRSQAVTKATPIAASEIRDHR